MQGLACVQEARDANWRFVKTICLVNTRKPGTRPPQSLTRLRVGIVTWGLLGAWLLAQSERPAQGFTSERPGDAAREAVKPAQSRPLRVAFVTPAATQPHPRDKAVIFHDDFDQLPDWRTRYFEFADAHGSFVWTAGEGLRGGAMRCQFAQGQVSAGALQVLFGKNPFGRGIRPDETFREIWWRVYVKHEAGWEGNPAKLARATCLAGRDYSQGFTNPSGRSSPRSRRR